MSGSAAAPTDPTAGAGGADPGSTDTDTGDTSSSVLVTIASAPDGGYMVYSGDEPDGDDGESADDGAASGAGGPAAGAGDSGGGQHCDSIGAALKAALDILQESASSAGAPGSADDQFSAGYRADQAPTPASGKGRGSKYPPAGG